MSQTPQEPGRRPPPSTPRWVKVSAVIVIILIVLLVRPAGIFGKPVTRRV